MSYRIRTESNKSFDRNGCMTGCGCRVRPDKAEGIETNPKAEDGSGLYCGTRRMMWPAPIWPNSVRGSHPLGAPLPSLCGARPQFPLRRVGARPSSRTRSAYVRTFRSPPSPSRGSSPPLLSFDLDRHLLVPQQCTRFAIDIMKSQ